MSNTPTNPNDPLNPKDPWIYSNDQQNGSESAGYYPAPVPPTPQPVPVAPIPGAIPPENTPANLPPSVPAAAPALPLPFPKPRPPALIEPSFKPLNPQPAQSDASLASIIDTIEAIIIALIVALTFRAFIVEAFVIPTGSMAPTLLGAHFNAVCPKCGYEFTRSANLGFQVKKAAIPLRPDEKSELINNSLVPCDELLPIYCPNCHYPILPEQLPQYLGTQNMRDDRRGTGALHDVPFAWANNGDRILVLKYLYAVMEPSHWDVIVFKEPQTARDNYIKRLIGLPGETLEIIDGDIYIAPPGKTSRAESLIARKPEYIQNRLWQLVYDNDYYPTDEGMPRPTLPDLNGDSKGDFIHPAWENPWVPTTSAWTHGTVRNYTGVGPSGLQFQVGPNMPYAQNTLGYNDDISTRLDGGPRSFVGDLRVETLWTPATVESASLAITLGKLNNRYRAIWSANGPEAGLELFRFDIAKNGYGSVLKVPASDLPLPKVGHAYLVAMNNVDHGIHVYIDGKCVVAFETTWTAEMAAQQTIDRRDNEPPTIALDVAGPCTLAHLKLFRDLYYTDERGSPTRTANIGNPITLGPDEFFAMGDNSRKSSDSRLWSAVFPALDDLGTRHGVVPRRYLLGKAFFVYWPAGYRPTSNTSIPLFSTLPLVPNAGDMRFIH